MEQITQERKPISQSARRALRVIKSELYAQANATVRREIMLARRNRHNIISRWETD